MPIQSIKKVLITDLDNTLFDWLDLWYVRFAPMMQKIAEIAGIDVEVLKPHIRLSTRSMGPLSTPSWRLTRNPYTESACWA
jgi:FMN phosphatase YigB (HAD superfamily)